MRCERFVQEGVVRRQDFAYGAILANKIIEEQNGLVVHGRLHFLRELREASGVDAFELVEAVEAEPLAEKLGGKAPGLLVGHHALHLTLELLRAGQLTSGGSAAQFG